MADVVRQDDVVLGVERLAGAEQLAGKLAAAELPARAAGAVHDQDGVGDDALRVLPRRAEVR